MCVRFCPHVVSDVQQLNFQLECGILLTLLELSDLLVSPLPRHRKVKHPLRLRAVVGCETLTLLNAHKVWIYGGGWFILHHLPRECDAHVHPSSLAAKIKLVKRLLLDGRSVELHPHVVKGHTRPHGSPQRSPKVKIVLLMPVISREAATALHHAEDGVDCLAGEARHEAVADEATEASLELELVVLSELTHQIGH